MEKMKYIVPETDIINISGKQNMMDDWGAPSKTGTWDNGANENTFEDEDDPWNNLSGWDDLGGWSQEE
ncbi:MAG: hypothetical protein J6M54_02415 [Prevotella sp.]|nr:hypothetical protein [Prevotella sp.]